VRARILALPNKAREQGAGVHAPPCIGRMLASLSPICTLYFVGVLVNVFSVNSENHRKKDFMRIGKM